MNPKVEQRVEDKERPVRSCAGVVLANDAYHCRVVDLWPKGVAEAKPEWITAINDYLWAFARPVRTIADEIRCVACDKQVTGAHVGLAEWRTKTALTYSEEGDMEGRCTGCGYPARLRHRILTRDQTAVLVELKGFPLFYHPDATVKTN